MNNTKQLARVSLFHLKEATLSVLLQAQRDQEGPLTTRVIRERLGIPKAEAEGDFIGWEESLMWGILLHLKSEGRIENYQEGPNQLHQWKITENEAELLSELSNDNLYETT